MDREHMHETLETHPHVLDALDAAIARYHPATQHHSHRVEQIAGVIGAALTPPLDREQLEALCWASHLHDLGKLGVAVQILMKRGPLTTDEWIDVRHHPQIGSDLVRSISTRLEPVAAGIRSHHERWDGAGYPKGLAGASIPRVARVIAVADAYDAVTNHRPYDTRAHSVHEAVDVLAPDAGSHFDPSVTDALERAATSGALEPEALRVST
jgi:HD-GYP domain-containing protein (c-di-GMP phosphodiesterase class II)